MPDAEIVEEQQGELLELASLLAQAEDLARVINMKHRHELVTERTTEIIANSCKSMYEWVMIARAEVKQ